MEVGTGTSATSRRCWMCRPVGPAAQASGKDQMTESTLNLKNNNILQLFWMQ